MLLTTFNSLSPFAKAALGLWPAYSKHKSLLQGCVGLWAPCAGPSGTVLYDFVGGNHLPYIGTFPAWRVGTYGWEIDFAGVTAFKSTTVALPSTGSITAWIKQTATDGIYRTIAEGGVNDSPYFGVSSGRLSVWPVALSSSVVTPGVWHHVGFTSAGSTNVFCDGVVVATSASQETFGAGFAIGQYQGDYKFNGSISTVTLHSGAISEAAMRLLGARPDIVFDLDETAILAALKSGQLPLVAKYPPSYRYYTRRRWA